MMRTLYCLSARRKIQIYRTGSEEKICNCGSKGSVMQGTGFILYYWRLIELFCKQDMSLFAR